MENQAAIKMSVGDRPRLLVAARESSLSPGVYLMKDEQGGILYVGKAKSLRGRLSSYFQSGPHESPRTDMLVARIHHFDVILTETEAEALILECTLIKKHRPKFNVRLKDDKAYPYLKIQLHDPFPRIEWTRRVRKDGARYFGPFPSAWAARQVMELLNETLLLRDCSDNTFRHRSRPCILYQMGRCTGACVGKIDENGYQDCIREAIAILEGKSDRLTRCLSEAMTESAENEEYELAAQYRDQLRNLETVTATQVVDEAGTDRSRDVAAIARKGTLAQGVLLQIRGGRLTAIRHYNLQNADPSLSESEILFDFLSQYYAAADHAADTEAVAPIEEAARGFGPTGPALAKPGEVLVSEAPNDPELLQRALGVTIRVLPPNSGDGGASFERQLMNVARANVEHALEQAEKRDSGHDLQSLEDVQKKLHLAALPARIECYDISNIQGEDAVASRVVFVDGAPDKNLYRRYKIRTVEGANDFAMMKEVLGRRFAVARGQDAAPPEDLPDLVVVDGGKGQLAQAEAILAELSVQGVSLAGLAKARVERDFQAKDVKSSPERVFIPNRKNPIVLLPHTGAFRLLTHIRDEAHRFAISYHRLLRGKRSLGKNAKRT